MPPEWHPHDACWMGWPCNRDLWGKHFDAAQRAYAEVARTIARFEPLIMLANPDTVESAKAQCGPTVTVIECELDDSWLRDSAPTFAFQHNELIGIDWQFNGWGERYPQYKKDAQTARFVIDHLSLKRIEAPFVMEGGAFHTDGEGTLLVTEQCMTHRNPSFNKADYEQLFHQYLGIEKIIWLKGGVVDDDTTGHVDVVANFAKPSVILAMTTDDESDDNYATLKQNYDILCASTDANGRPLEIISIPQPDKKMYFRNERLAFSYINFYFANGAIILPVFDDPQDAVAQKIFGKLFPDREIVSISGIEIFHGGGGIHCITQQQPKVLKG